MTAPADTLRERAVNAAYAAIDNRADLRDDVTIATDAVLAVALEAAAQVAETYPTPMVARHEIAAAIRGLK